MQTKRALNPLKIKLSEAPSKITIKHADSTLTLEAYVIDDPDQLGTDLVVDPTGGDNVATVDFLNINAGLDEELDDQPSDQPVWFEKNEDDENVVDGVADNKYVAQAGTEGALVITVRDSLGNETVIDKDDFAAFGAITLDGNTPGVKNLFPTDATAPKDSDNEDAATIDPFTKNPVFLLDETLDSLSIRYHEQGGGKAIVQYYQPGNSRLEPDAGGCIPSAKLPGERYHLHGPPEVRAGGAGDRPGGQRQREEGRHAHVQRRL